MLSVSVPVVDLRSCSPTQTIVHPRGHYFLDFGGVRRLLQVTADNDVLTIKVQQDSKTEDEGEEEVGKLSRSLMFWTHFWLSSPVCGAKANVSYVKQLCCSSEGSQKLVQVCIDLATAICSGFVPNERVVCCRGSSFTARKGHPCL